ncbi:MAG: TIGR02391 family protein [Candidatus Paceibacterota bacterium]
MSDHFDTMQVCRNGHMITAYYDTYPAQRQKFCNKCGEKTIHQCENCNAEIRGFHTYDGIIGGEDAQVENNCYNCGQPYPWASAVKLNTATVEIPLGNLHPKVIEVSQKLFEDKHYSQAIFEAYKAVVSELKGVSGLSNLDGKPLAEAALSLVKPKVKLNKLETQSEKDEQQGFMFLYSGAALGVRNPKAHDNMVQSDPIKTFEYLSFASLLLRRLDERIEND